MAVEGIGGFFFRADDPDALTVWYRQHFGVTMDGYEPWKQQAGPTVFMPFARDSDAFPPGQPWMINFRVSELDALVATLRTAGIAVETKAEWDTPETGRFARLADPEGHPIELWEPPAE